MIIGPGITFTGGIYVDANAPAASSGGIVTSGLQFNLATAPSTGSTWTDSSGNGRNATLQGSPSYVSNNGGGIRLNNPDINGTDYISVPYNIASNTVTVEVIASFNPTSFWGSIWGNEIYNDSGGYLAYMPDSTDISYGIPNSETAVTITESNDIRQWIFVINGTQGSLFLNGSQVGTTGTIGNQTLFATGGFQFGSRFAFNDGTGYGDVMNNAAFYPVFYQMRVYNKALSGAEITQNYNAVKDTYGL
jgi:large repetitive protein